MRKFLIILLLPSFLTISKVVSTEKEVVYTSKEIYYLSQSDFGIYFREKLSSQWFMERFLFMQMKI